MIDIGKLNNNRSKKTLNKYYITIHMLQCINKLDIDKYRFIILN